ncbi:MAG TPA: FAD-binding oxidoreductase [Candidatus Sulfotelmatobacter sp.]|nr:FAD-binding oxidoreductase [Candidatus Sulfotelmatobacter sp.]
MGDLQAAIRQWRELLGDEHVLDDMGSLEAVSQATYPTAARATAVVQPSAVDEVQECVRIAARNRISLHAFSTGKNWGYGSRVPARDGAVLLDLHRLNRIVDYDDELGLLTVEPGVTQEQVFTFLKDRGGRFWMDGTGSTPDAGLVGNIMERGFGLTPYGDHVSRACAFEVVLPDGELLHTGFGAYPGARVGVVDRWSPGPQLDGLFSHSDYGIVTRLTTPPMPAAETALMAVMDLRDTDQLRRAIDIVRGLQLDGTIRSAPWFGNHYRLLGTVMRFPWHRSQPPLAPAASVQIAAEHGLYPWTGFAAIYGSAEQVAASRRRLESALSSTVSALTFVDSATLDAEPVSARRSIHLSMHRAYTGGLLNAVRRAYWRKRSTPPADADPDRDRVGFIFVNASIPFRGEDAAAAAHLAERVILEHGFEPSFSCHSIRERVLQALSTFAWDRDIPGDDERAFAAHDQVADTWAEHGWFPFRLGLHSMPLRERAEPSHRRTVAAIKGALDPSGVLAPDRYS